MLNIPELDNMVCRQLGPHDLARCARVSKRWHTLAIPHLWHDLTWLKDIPRTRRQAFHLVVLEDYLAKQQRQRLQDEGRAMELPTQPPSHPLPTLSKYGHRIRLLPDPCRLQMVLGSNPTGENKLLESELLRHLFTRCSPDVQVKSFWLYTYSLSLERDNLMREMIDFTLPRLRHLHIQVPLPIPQTRASGLMDLLDRCGTLLWKLELNIGVIGDAGTNVKDAPTEYEPNGWASLKELTLYEWNDKANDKTFWSWLFKRCGQVENLEVREFWGTAEFLAQAMLTHMPKLNQCTLGISNQPSQMPEDAVATLLSGSCNGWKRVKLGSGAVFGGMAMNALEKHYSTLEALDLSGCGQSSNDFVQVLRSCTHLHSFANFGHYGRVDARAFIDLDPETGSLRPWKCEATLKELKVRIAGAPRSYMEHDSDPEKECPDPGFNLNGRLYDRLARLTHLETLHLGDKDPDDDLLDLEMSLESGLHKLAGLRSLKELSVGSSSTKVNVKEVRWMVKHWPRLRVIKGLHEDGNSWEAVEWLRNNHPQIEVLEEMSCRSKSSH